MRVLKCKLTVQRTKLALSFQAGLAYLELSFSSHSRRKVLFKPLDEAYSISLEWFKRGA